MKLTTRQKRAGATRIGIVVIVLMVLVIAGVFLAFLRRAWERSYRVTCMNNLRVLGDGVFAFQEEHKFLPASCIDKKYATWAVQIVPYIESFKDTELAKWKMPRTYYAQPEDVRTAQLRIFYCPARRPPGHVSTSGDVPSDEKDGKNFAGALGDYAACSGSGGEWKTADANGAIIIGNVLKKEDDRIVNWVSRTRLTDESLPRGKQYTILIGEKHVPQNGWGQVASGDGSLYNGDYFGSFARIGGPGHTIAPTITSPYNENFGSYHAGICYFLYADGNVQGHSTSMSASVLGRLTNRH